MFKKFQIKYYLILLTIFIFFTLNFILAQKLINLFKEDLKPLNPIFFTTTVNESFNVLISLTFYLTFLMVLPIGIYLFYIYIKDALYEKEKKFFKVLYISMVLGLLGAVFGYFITIKLMIPFLYGYNTLLSLENYTTLSALLYFIINNMIIFYIMFQMPIILKSLIKLQIIEKNLLKKYRKHFFIITLIFGAMLTPPDAISMFAVAIPAHILYEISIF